MRMRRMNYNGRWPHRSRGLRPPRPDHPATNLSQQPIKRRAILGGPSANTSGRVRAQVKPSGRVLEPRKVLRIIAMLLVAPSGRGLNPDSATTNASGPAGSLISVSLGGWSADRPLAGPTPGMRRG